MPTLWQKFPGVANIDKKASIYPISCVFSAPLLGGKFLFQNVSSFAFKGNASQMFVLDGLTLSANINQLVFNDAIDPLANGGMFSVDIKRAGNGGCVTLAPFRFTAFNQGSEFAANFYVTATDNGEERFNMILSGGLIQTPDIIALGLASIDIIATANIYIVKQDASKGL